MVTEGEDGLPCRHPDLDWLDGAATCPECGALLAQTSVSGLPSVGSTFTPMGPEAEDEVNVPLNPPNGVPTE